MKYRHITLEERVELYALLKQKMTLRDIAKKLHRNHSSLSRELKNHSKYIRAYKPVIANNQAVRWAKKQRYKAPLKNSETFRYVMDKIKQYWSPADISGRISLDHPELSICVESIYSWIYSRKWKKHELWKYLDGGHLKRRQKRGRKVLSYTQVMNTKSIDLRPNEANLRLEMGHKETDLIEGGRNHKAALSVTVDRLTRVVSLVKVKDKTGREKLRALSCPAPDKAYWKTVTSDKGPENKSYEKWEIKLNILVFFCHAYHSWEKGTVERINRYIRKFIPKGEDIGNYSWRDIKKIEYWFNHKPLKCLQYLTPYEKMQLELNSLKSTG